MFFLSFFFFLLERLPLPAERRSPRSPVKIEKAPPTLLAAPTHLSSADKAFGSGDGGGPTSTAAGPGVPRPRRGKATCFTERKAGKKAGEGRVSVCVGGDVRGWKKGKDRGGGGAEERKLKEADNGQENNWEGGSGGETDGGRNQ